MLTDFDQNTIANMTAALEYVCNRIPAEKDASNLRKEIGAAMIECANRGKRTFVDFQKAGMDVLADVLRPPKFDWFGLGRLFRRL
ncbi:MAG TPA: hypothetical protein VFL62_20915 [Bradyrhizobium sp.]|uniref:hypothetical protein n=1 Tax=Bradyrhizobium sp. TaxID=376 RepID=UPI002D7FFCA3|nr:hypothetical protein [Bradyrhizobium sp.]HET7888694.1 hypothetical protein [Bradyrhizobium sp.]